MSESLPASLRFVVEGTPAYLEGYTIYTEALQLMVDQKRALVADDWDELARLANLGLGQAHGAYSEMQRTVGVLSSMVSAVNKELAELLAAHAKDAQTRQEFFTNVADELTAGVPDEFVEGVEAFSEGKVRGNPLYEWLTRDDPEVEDADKVASAIDATVALATRSLIGLTFANFQRHHATLLAIEFQPAGDTFREALEEHVRSFEQQLDACVHEVYSDAAAGSSPIPAAETLMRTLEDLLPAFGRVQATLRRYSLFLKDEGRGGASEDAGRLCAAAGDLTRSAFASYAAGFYLALQYRASSRDEGVEALLANADRTAYDKPLPKGKQTEIAKIGERADGTYVRVTGFIDSVKTGRDDDRKLVSRVTLRDPSSDTTVVAAGIFVHLLHRGLSQDAYCIVNGEWQTASGLNRGQPAIQIEKLSVNSLGSQSWKTAFQDVANKFIERWPGSLNIQYGLSPHESGDKEGRSRVLGAGELIYEPFID